MKKSPLYFLSIVMLLLIVVLVIALVVSCADPGMVSTTNSSTDNTLAAQSTTTDLRLANPFTKTVGASIAIAQAKKWMENYISFYGQGFEYLISADALMAILAQPNCNGITFRYGVDANNQLHIIPVGVDNTGTEMKSDRVPTSAGYVSWEEAKKLTGNYHGPVRSHYFGANTFDRLLKTGDFKILKITAALNDDNQPLLLLTNASIPESEIVEDESSPCPATCESMQN